MKSHARVFSYNNRAPRGSDEDMSADYREHKRHVLNGTWFAGSGCPYCRHTDDTVKRDQPLTIPWVRLVNEE